MEGNKAVITTKLKAIPFDLAKDAGNNLNYEISFIIKRNDILVEQIIKEKIINLLSKSKHGNDINH